MPVSPPSPEASEGREIDDLAAHVKGPFVFLPGKVSGAAWSALGEGDLFL